MTTKFTVLFREFLESAQASGIILILCTLVSIIVANSTLSPGYVGFWHHYLGVESETFSLKLSIEHWINDGLMAIFFLLIGLEIERELYIGELSDLKNALLPVIAASGGMVIPALLHFFFNRGTETQAGIAIPMATDIAFALGVLALLGSKVPASLKIFLTALAIVDDLGAIIIIALFYVGNFSLSYLLAALGVFGLLVAMNRLGIHRLPVYLLPGVVMWYFMYKSGIHATLAGILLAFAIPFGQGDAASPSYRLQHALHKPTSFLIMPLFALANTGIILDGNWAAGLLTASSMGIIIGLVLGKPLGIALFSLIAVKSGLSQLPEGVTWQHIIGAGCLGGIGFTMSIFITLLAFNSPELVQNAKTSILLSSLTAGFLGYLLLARSAPHPNIVVSVHR